VLPCGDKVHHINFSVVFIGSTMTYSGVARPYPDGNSIDPRKEAYEVLVHLDSALSATKVWNKVQQTLPNQEWGILLESDWVHKDTGAERSLEYECLNTGKSTGGLLPVCMVVLRTAAPRCTSGL